MYKDFVQTIETLKIIIEALRGDPQVFDKKSIYKMPVNIGNCPTYDKRFNWNISPAFHRKILQE